MKQNKSALSTSLDDQQEKLLSCGKNKYDIHICRSKSDRKGSDGKLDYSAKSYDEIIQMKLFTAFFNCFGGPAIWIKVLYFFM